MSNPIYYLEAVAENCIVEAEINGYPFYKLNARFKSFFGSPLNIGLIKGSNRITVNIRPAIEDLVGAAEPKIEVEIKLKQYEKGGVTAPELGKVLHEQTITGFGSFPLSLQNESKIDFTSFFNAIEKVEDEAEDELKTFAERIVQSVKQKDLAFLREAFTFKLQQYALAYSEDPGSSIDQALRFLKENILDNPPEDYIPDGRMIVYRPYCDKKIWYCHLANMQDLIYSAYDDAEEQHFIPIYISKINGEFKIVR